MSGFRPGGPADSADAAAFLGRVVALDAGALVRLRGAGGRVTAHARLPFGVPVSRTIAGTAEPADVTVGAADLLAALDRTAGASPAETDRSLPAAAEDPTSGFERGPPETDEVLAPGAGSRSMPRAAAGSGGGMVAWPARRDVEWRAALPPTEGWHRLDSVPGDVVRSLVRAGREALRAVPAGAAASAGESLLDHESLTVSGAGRTAAVPLRVLGALTRMGFLGADSTPGTTDGDVVVVSAAGGWVRLAAAYGSAYRHAAPSLGLSLR